jgi:prepilin peptidase CpaA
MPSAYLADAVLAVTSGVLFFVAVTDLKRYTIRNEFIAVLAGLFLIYVAVTGRWGELPWHLALAAAIFLLLLYFYARYWMGGGDVKMLSVAFLWVGPEGALPFAILLCLFACLHGLAAKFEWVPAQQLPDDRRKRIPFAPSIAAALVGVFVLGALYQPA